MIIPRTEVENLIKLGNKSGISGKDVIDSLIKKGFEPEGVNVGLIKKNLEQKEVQKPEVQKPNDNSFTNEIKSDLNTRVERTGNILSRPDSSILEKSVQVFGQGAGLGSNIIEKTVEQIPGVKQASRAIGKGIEWLSQTTPIKYIGGKIGDSKLLQELTTLYDTDKNFRDSVDAVANVVRLGGDIEGTKQAVDFTKNVMSRVNNLIDRGATKSVDALNKLSQKIGAGFDETPSNIMNRVARLNPSDAQKFEKLSGGKTHGEYLAETGNFGTPDEIITKEAQKFSRSISSVDAEIDKLPGLYKTGSIEDALSGLVKRAEETSSSNTKAPYLIRVNELVNKYNKDGLTMKEINEVKRLFEREAKLGYNKLTQSDSVAKATNIDNALREWQFAKADELGFKNLENLNKQTQLSKLIVDSLGDKIVGQTGLNGISLTDWIILGSGNPNSVAQFLTKKFFSSKKVQAKIAEMLYKGEKKSIITPETIMTPENIKRQVSPLGLEALPEGTPGTAPTVNVPIRVGGKSTIEAPAKSIRTQYYGKPQLLTLPSGENIINSADVVNVKPINLPESITKTNLGLDLVQNAELYMTKINKKTGDVYVKNLKTGKISYFPKK